MIRVSESLVEHTGSPESGVDRHQEADARSASDQLSRLHCLLVITRGEIGGAQSHVLELLRGLGSRHHLMLACGDDGWLVAQARQLGVACTIVPDLVHPIRPFSDWSAFRALRSLISTWKPQVVHAHSSKAGVIARFASASLGTPCVFTAHGWAFQPSYPWMRRTIALFCERLSASIGHGPIICVSNFDRNLARRHHFPGTKIRVVPNGMPDFPAAHHRESHDPARVIMVARFAAPKDFRTVLRAVALLPSVQLELVGEGPDQSDIKQLAEELNLGARCTFSGTVHDVPRRLQEAGVFVLSSRTEGLPVCIIEAMRAGLPVIASAVGGIPELVDDGVSGLLVPPRDARALAEALSRLIENPGLAQSMGRAGRQRFLDHFQQEAMLLAVEQTWMDAVTNGAER